MWHFFDASFVLYFLFRFPARLQLKYFFENRPLTSVKRLNFSEIPQSDKHISKKLILDMRAVKKISSIVYSCLNFLQHGIITQEISPKNNYTIWKIPILIPHCSSLTDSVYLQTQSPFLLRCHVGIYFHMPEQSGFILRHLHLFFTNLEFLRIPYQAFNWC